MSMMDCVSKYKFVREPEDALKCPICLDVAEEPWQHGKCGRLFCKQCLHNLNQMDHHDDNTMGSSPCPHCREVKPLYFEDNKSKREIKALSVKCNSLDGKCSWNGALSALNDHMSTCKFALHMCPKLCVSNKKFTVIELTKHLESDCSNRDYQCEHCGMKDTYVGITRNHDKICSKKVIMCTNVGCKQTMRRLKLKKHLQCCKFGKVPCKYGKLGCKVMKRRLDIKSHEQDVQSHLHMSLETVAKLEDEKGELRKKVSALEDRLLKGTFKMTDCESKKEATTLFESPTLTTADGFKMGAFISFSHIGNDGNVDRSLNPTHVTIIAYAASSSCRFYPMESQPVVGCFYFQLLNQLEDANHYEVCFPLKEGGDSFGRRDFISINDLDYDSYSNTQYLKDDTMYFRMYVEVDSKPWLVCSADIAS